MAMNYRPTITTPRLLLGGGSGRKGAEGPLSWPTGDRSSRFSEERDLTPSTLAYKPLEVETKWLNPQRTRWQPEEIKVEIRVVDNVLYDIDETMAPRYENGVLVMAYF